MAARHFGIACIQPVVMSRYKWSAFGFTVLMISKEVFPHIFKRLKKSVISGEHHQR
jgi:hypothetical protein